MTKNLREVENICACVASCKVESIEEEFLCTVPVVVPHLLREIYTVAVVGPIWRKLQRVLFPYKVAYPLCSITRLFHSVLRQASGR
jgi:hypothetical protein